LPEFVVPFSLRFSQIFWNQIRNTKSGLRVSIFKI
jgi:hypothetical protein